MKAVMFPGDSKVEIVELPTPVPGPGEVLIRNRASAICRSDMGLYTGQSNIVGGDGAGKGQIVPGHEAAGEIAAVGANVTHLKVGDRVAVHLAFGCGSCDYCKSGYTMLCPTWKCMGFDVNGGNAEYMIAPASNALLLPDELSFAAGAILTDMIGSQYSLQTRMGVSGASTVAVIGLGPMGLAAIMVAAGLGATCYAIDIIESRLHHAEILGASKSINAKSEDVGAVIKSLTNGQGVSVSIDCSGSPAGQNSALDIVAKLGSTAFVGESRATEINPSDQIIRKLLKVYGGWYFALNEWGAIVDFVVRQKVPVESMITHRYSLDEAAEAFASFDRRETEKSVFIWD